MGALGAFRAFAQRPGQRISHINSYYAPCTACYKKGSKWNIALQVEGCMIKSVIF